jgi:hypothetical protein
VWRWRNPHRNEINPPSQGGHANLLAVLAAVDHAKRRTKNLWFCRRGRTIEDKIILLKLKNPHADSTTTRRNERPSGML